MPKAPKREVSREREREAWRLRQEFYTQDEIAQKLGVTQAAVSIILKRVEKRVLAELKESIEARKATQTVQLDRIASEAFRAWQKSLADAETVKTIQVAVPQDQERKREQVRLFLERFESDAVDVLDDDLDSLISAIADGSEDDRTERTLRGQSGNPSLLSQVREALADQRKIWGMDAPPKSAVPDEPTEPPPDDAPRNDQTKEPIKV